MKKEIALLGIAGFFIGALWSFSPGTVFVLSLVVLSSTFLAGVIASADEKRFAVALLVAGFALRALLSLSLDAGAWWMNRAEAFGFTPDRATGIPIPFENSRGLVRIGDSDYYSNRSYGIARYAQGARDAHAMGARFQSYGRHGYLYVTGFFYYLFGFSPIAGKLFTCFWGGLIGVFVYLVARSLFAAPVARWAGVATACFPSLILWSASHLKDAAIIALGVALVLLFVRWQQSMKLPQPKPYAALFGLAFVAHVGIRSEIYSLALLGCLGFSFLFTRLSWRWRLALIVLLASVLFFIREDIRSGIGYALAVHKGHMKTSPGTSYSVFPSSSYTGLGPPIVIGWNAPFLLGIARAIAHYLLEPLPWRGGSFMRFLAVPQMMFWYVALFFAGVGILFALVRMWRRSFPLLLITAAWTLLGALTNGNVGTVFRMRDMVTPFFLIFASVGWWVCRGQPK